MNWKHFIYAIKIKLKKAGYSNYADEIIMTEVANSDSEIHLLSEVVNVINKIERDNFEAFESIISETDSLRQALKRKKR